MVKRRLWPSACSRTVVVVGKANSIPASENLIKGGSVGHCNIGEPADMGAPSNILNGTGCHLIIGYNHLMSHQGPDSSTSEPDGFDRTIIVIDLNSFSDLEGFICHDHDAAEEVLKSILSSLKLTARIINIRIIIRSNSTNVLSTLFVFLSEKELKRVPRVSTNW
jgi:hypothetical protein